jgi:hypothetical protein
MNLDRVCIVDAPELTTRYQHDDAPEQLGDGFELSTEQKARINRAANEGKSLITRARAGDAQALEELETKMHVTRYVVAR